MAACRTILAGAAALAAVLLAPVWQAGAAEPTLIDGGTAVRLDVPALDGRAPETVLRVTVDGRTSPIAGAYTRVDGAIVFRPRFGFRPGVAYRALACIGGDGGCAGSLRFTIPEAGSGPPPAVAAVYPSGRTVPENLLRIHIRFATPMARGQLRRHVSLRRADGGPVAAPFLDPGIELWDAQQRRATLLLDPGRIKRGVGPNRSAGPPLERDVGFVLVVDGAMVDAAGRPLGSPVEWTFRVGPPRRDRLDPASWSVSPVREGTRAPLTVGFDRPIDRLGLASNLRVEGPDGMPVPGGVTIAPGETAWRFTPDRAWSAGPYGLRVGGRLEDVAGNTLDFAFDRPATDPAPPDRPASRVLAIETASPQTP